jgi:RNA polymerase sigma-70 factor, ECF subfamily
MLLSDYDRELLERCLSKQSGAWNQFVDRFVGLVLHVIRHSARIRGIPLRPEDEEDIAAEVFFALVDDDYAALRRFRGEAALATYLTIIARRIAVRELLQNKALLNLPDRHDEHHQGNGHHHGSPPDEPADPASGEAVDRWENKQDVERVLSRLGGVEARILRFFHLEGKSYQEIARTCGVPENSVGPMLARARRKAALILPGEA